MAKNTGKVREFCQSGKVGTLTGCRCYNEHAAVTNDLFLLKKDHF